MRNHEKGYFNIVSFHGGQEHINYPNYDHILMARQFASVCPYFLYGHHPHVLQGIEDVNGSLVAYSLGNLLFDDVYTSKSTKPLIKQSEKNKQSVVLSVEFSQNNIKNYCLSGIFADEKKYEVNISEIAGLVQDYSEWLNISPETYKKDREKLWNEYLLSRKQNRDSSWYLKRANLNSLLMILQARKNYKQYKLNVLKYLK